jgi:hypothetical protein
MAFSSLSGTTTAGRLASAALIFSAMSLPSIFGGASATMGLFAAMALA